MMPQARFSWYCKDNGRLRLYSRAAIGLAIQYIEAHSEHPAFTEGKRNKTQCQFGYQVSGFGIDVGGRHFRGFTEVGLGFQGIMIFGLKYCF
ncbi:MAG: hypothetical protein ACOYJF_08010 [Prevotella sp.]